jgi:hypothetical protein
VNFAAGRQDPLAFLEKFDVDEGTVGVGGGDVAEADFAEVEPVGKHATDGEAGPGFVLAGALALRVELFGDGAGDDPGAGVEGEDLPDGVLLVGMRHKPCVSMSRR